jgi:hypothetical protein
MNQTDETPFSTEPEPPPSPVEPIEVPPPPPDEFPVATPPGCGTSDVFTTASRASHGPATTSEKVEHRIDCCDRDPGYSVLLLWWNIDLYFWLGDLILSILSSFGVQVGLSIGLPQLINRMGRATPSHPVFISIYFRNWFVVRRVQPRRPHALDRELN